MREIKFRAWDNKNGYMVTSKQGVYTALRNIMDMVKQDNGYYTNGDLLKPNKEKYILMQYTGLKDNNGKEIYENMIINNKYIVDYDFGKFVLKNIESGDIADFKKDGVYEITREYFE